MCAAFKMIQQLEVRFVASVKDVVLLIFVGDEPGKAFWQLPENLCTPCSIRIVRFIQYVEDAFGDDFTGRKEFALIRR